MPAAYIKKILNARVYDVAIETPLMPMHQLSARLDNTLLLKREDLQPVFSFKLRGAYNKMRNLTAEQRARGVVAASAGNLAVGPGTDHALRTVSVPVRGHRVDVCSALCAAGG